jgi:probable phosphoglycerate mutase
MLQAEAVGARIAHEKIAAIYSSDLGRAKQTAEYIARPTKLSIVTDVRLRERSLGIFQGLNSEEVAAKYPEEMRRYNSRDPHYALPGGQSVVEHFQIGLSFLDEVAARHRGQSIVAVTHGGLVQAMFRHVTGVALDAPRRFAIRNAAYNVFLHDEGGWSLETWGDISHYPPEILTSSGFHVENYTPEVQ